MVAVAAWARGGHGGKGPGRVLTVIEHATTDATTDTGAAGDSAGDIVTFANDVFDRADAHKVGTDQGCCVRIVAGTSYECNWTTILAGGQITVEGPFLDAGDSTLAARHRRASSSAYGTSTSLPRAAERSSSS